MRSLVFIGLRALVTIFALLGLFLIVMRLGAPWPVHGEETQQAEMAAIVTMLNNLRHDDRDLYLSIDGGDPNQGMLKSLRTIIPGRSFKAISERSNANDRCFVSSAGITSMGACQSDDFLRVNFLAMPLWRISFVSINSAACNNEYVLFKGLSNWHVFSHRWLCA